MLQSDYDDLKYEYIGSTMIDVFTKEKIIGKYNIILNNEIIKTIDIYKPKTIDFSILLFMFNYWYVFIILIIILIFTKLKHNKII